VPEKPTERFRKHKKGERRVRDPITGGEIIIKDIDKHGTLTAALECATRCMGISSTDLVNVVRIRSQSDVLVPSAATATFRA